MEIQWYNAARTPNEAILKSHKNTSQFLEYGAIGDYRNYASSLGCTEEETFSKIYAGVQVVSNGSTGYTYALNRAMPTSGHVGSLDLFNPEEHIWKDNVKYYLGTKDECGEKAYKAITQTSRMRRICGLTLEVPLLMSRKAAGPAFPDEFLSVLSSVPCLSRHLSV